jgi:hypothetical protein
MLMLTAYMDEAGHSEDPALHFVGMAGFVAPSERWQDFADKWRTTLDEYGLREPFHMKDYAHSVKQFKGWTKEKKKELFGKLLEIIQRTNAKPVGAVVSLEGYASLTQRQQKYFYNPYITVFQICTRGLAITGMPVPNIDLPPGEKVAMVYSYNQEFGTIQTEAYSVNQAGRAESLWHEMKRQTDFGKWMGAYASSTPAETIQLQAADIFAYELCKEFENRINRPNDEMRFGLRQILKMSRIPLPMIRLLDRRELLRIVLENRWPCQVGVEELEEKQELSAMQAMEKWMTDRGHWNAQ